MVIRTPNPTIGISCPEFILYVDCSDEKAILEVNLLKELKGMTLLEENMGGIEVDKVEMKPTIAAPGSLFYEFTDKRIDRKPHPRSSSSIRFVSNLFTIMLAPLESITIDQISHALDNSHFCEVDLVEAYLRRIAEVNDTVHAVIEVNPDAENIARQLEEERRRHGRRRGYVFLVPLSFLH